MLQDTKKQEKQDKNHQAANPHLEEEGTRKVTHQEEEKMMKGQKKTQKKCEKHEKSVSYLSIFDFEPSLSLSSLHCKSRDPNIFNAPRGNEPNIFLGKLICTNLANAITLSPVYFFVEA